MKLLGIIAISFGIFKMRRQQQLPEKCPRLFYLLLFIPSEQQLAPVGDAAVLPPNEFRSMSDKIRDGDNKTTRREKKKKEEGLTLCEDVTCS